ncbi:techylectin-5A [Trichonephila clavata]|uniref:Techylectin-5A n=1 Tax=Trichonephila clavata TaxID=2740835 RepID=A0A8X6HC07_TRICU|nr:techylectin-5A [Trichonephila clavata]
MTCEKFEETDERGIKANVADVLESLNSKDVFKCVKHSKPIDCKEVLENGNTESGVYTIWPRSRSAHCAAIEVYCDLETAGGGWTVIQRRGDYGNAQNYFDKTWKDYKEGFGNLRGEFWLGNENIVAITGQALYSIRFDMKNKEGKSVFAVYESFWIDDESQKYKLHLQDYSGNAGDALTPHSGKEFYTKDQPNKPSDVKLGEVKHTGGWWFNTFTSSTLNGLNNNGEKLSNVQQGMSWNPFGGYSGSLVFSEIKVRPGRL